MFKKILVPVDGSKFSDLAIEKAKEIAGAFGSEIMILNVLEVSKIDYPSNPYKFSPELIENYQKESRIISSKILNEAQNMLEDMSNKVSIHSVEGNPSEEIVNYVNSHDIDLVIMGSSGMSGVLNLLGSVTRKVTLGIEKPILIVR
ncbi:Universal stress protein [Pelotomaculum schinkii]|uniref:Universal stress protein n=1 Tax=Pelotomaculum schinkii TaxID=78350 RepID=A0A4Y7R6Z0_9FIRM|nr:MULTISPECIES: universal stress protein [Pelotomaculum]TEB04411.1 Universal stress protein [Pelotomaculum schinkii]TEB15258.1 Universal stress protein [Pelotomaculum sp. FP]